MAKQSIIQREYKRQRLVAKYSDQRLELKTIIKDVNSSDEEKVAAQNKLQSLPVNSSKTRLRRRCKLTGRPHGNFRKFGISRNMIRQLAMSGNIPGITKASW